VLKDKSRDYTDKIRSILSNLRDPKNPELRARLIDGVITPVQVATMDATILASQSLKEERERMARLAVESSRTDYENEK
jgi:transcription elongation factor S-II